MGTGLFRGGEVKRQGRGVNYLPPSSAEVKKRVELYSYLYFSYGPSWPLSGQALPLPFLPLNYNVYNHVNTGSDHQGKNFANKQFGLVNIGQTL